MLRDLREPARPDRWHHSEQQSYRAMEDDRAKLLAQAERCRRLAASITDPETVERLTGLAEECERKAAGMSSATDEDKRGGP